MDKEHGRILTDRAAPADAAETVPVSGKAGIPCADELPRFAVSKEWDYLDLEQPREAWESFAEKLRRQMATHQVCADNLRKTAADALEQAACHDEQAAEFWNVLNAMQRAPITFPVPNGDAPHA